MEILKLLRAKVGEKNAKAEERIARQLQRNQERLVDDLDAKRDSFISKKEKLEAITFETAQSSIESWNTEYHKVLVDIALVDAEIKIAQETSKKLFNEKTK